MIKFRKMKPVKIVCRKLPARLTRKLFEEKFQKYFEKCIHITFVSGYHKDPQKRTCSMAFLTFSGESYAAEFKRACEGFLFVEEKGGSYKMEIEKAPYQKIVNDSENMLSEENDTFENTSEFKKFAEKVGARADPAPSVETLSQEIPTEPQVARLVQDLIEEAKVRPIVSHSHKIKEAKKIFLPKKGYKVRKWIFF